MRFVCAKYALNTYVVRDVHPDSLLGCRNKFALTLWNSQKVTWWGRALMHTSHKLNESFPNINLAGSYLRAQGVSNPTPSHRIIRSPYPDISFSNEPFHEFIWSGIFKWQEKKALSCVSTGRSYTYAEARDVSRNFAAALIRRGFGPGNVLAICLPNAPEYPLIVLGALEAGLTITALGTNFSEDDMRRQLKNSKPVVVVGAGDLLRRVLAAGADVGVHWKAVVALPDDLPGAGDGDLSQPLPSDILYFHHMVSVEENLAFNKDVQFPEVKGSDAAVITFTSGTTGPPKGVLLSHANTVASISQVTHEAFSQDRGATMTFQEELVANVPFYHIYGMFTVMMSRLRFGAHIVTIPNDSPEYYLQCLRMTKSTILALTPSLLMWLASLPSLPARHLENVHTVMCGGSPLTPENAGRLIARLKPSVMYQQGYGMAETTTAVTQTSKWVRSLGSAGYLVPNTRAKVIDQEEGMALGSGHTGEILVKGPQVMMGYLNDEDAMQQKFDSEGWFRTGDLGFYDDEHRFHVVDRVDEIIRVSGMHTLAVAPAELEQLLRAHPGVSDCAVVAVSHPQHGEVPRAFVVRGHSAIGARLTERELLDMVAQRSPPYKHILGGVQFIEQLPKSPTGNVKRYLLKRE